MKALKFVACAAAVALIAASAPALAQGGPRGGGGGFQGGPPSGGGGFHGGPPPGGGYRGGPPPGGWGYAGRPPPGGYPPGGYYPRWGGNVYFGYAPGWWGAGYWPGYWWPGYVYPGPVYGYVPPAVVQQVPPVAYVEREQPGEQVWWYWCADPGGYFPYVKACPGGWQRVAPQAAVPPDAQQNPQGRAP